MTRLLRVGRWWRRHPFVAALVLFGAINFVTTFRSEQNRERIAVVSLDRCRDSNARAAGARGKFQIQNDVFADLGIDPVAIARLSVVAGKGDDEDIDCNASGHVDTGDYPPGRSPAEILAALRAAAGLVVTSNPDQPVVIEATPVPSTTTSTKPRGKVGRPSTTTTTIRPPSPTTTAPSPPTTQPCTLLGVFVPLCPLPGL